MGGFLVVAVGGVLNLATRVVQNLVPPFRMGRMPFTGARTLDDLSRAPEFILVYAGHAMAALLIVLGTVMVVRTWFKHGARNRPSNERRN